MREHVRIEVAIEIISMCIAIAINKNDFNEVQRLNDERNKIYLEDEKIIKKVINQYGENVKRKLEGKNE